MTNLTKRIKLILNNELSSNRPSNILKTKVGVSKFFTGMAPMAMTSPMNSMMQFGPPPMMDTFSQTQNVGGYEIPSARQNWDSAIKHAIDPGYTAQMGGYDGVMNQAFQDFQSSIPNMGYGMDTGPSFNSSFVADAFSSGPVNLNNLDFQNDFNTVQNSFDNYNQTSFNQILPNTSFNIQTPLLNNTFQFQNDLLINNEVRLPHLDNINPIIDGWRNDFGVNSWESKIDSGIYKASFDLDSINNLNNSWKDNFEIPFIDSSLGINNTFDNLLDLPTTYNFNSNMLLDNSPAKIDFGITNPTFEINDNSIGNFASWDVQPDNYLTPSFGQDILNPNLNIWGETPIINKDVGFSPIQNTIYEPTSADFLSNTLDVLNPPNMINSTIEDNMVKWNYTPEPIINHSLTPNIGITNLGLDKFNTWDVMPTINTDLGFKPIPDPIYETSTIDFPNSTFDIINPITTIKPTIEDNIYKWNHTPEPTITNLGIQNFEFDKPDLSFNIWDKIPTIDTGIGFKPLPDSIYKPTIDIPNKTFDIINPIQTIKPTIEDNIYKWNHTPDTIITTNTWDEPLNNWDKPNLFNTQLLTDTWNKKPLIDIWDKKINLEPWNKIEPINIGIGLKTFEPIYKDTTIDFPNKTFDIINPIQTIKPTIENDIYKWNYTPDTIITTNTWDKPLNNTPLNNWDKPNLFDTQLLTDTWNKKPLIDTGIGFKPYNAIDEPNPFLTNTPLNKTWEPIQTIKTNQLWELNNNPIGLTPNTTFEPTTINLANNTFDIINPITTINPTIEDNIYKWNHTPEPTITNLGIQNFEFNKPNSSFNIWDKTPTIDTGIGFKPYNAIDEPNPFLTNTPLNKTWEILNPPSTINPTIEDNIYKWNYTPEPIVTNLGIPNLGFDKFNIWDKTPTIDTGIGFKPYNAIDEPNPFLTNTPLNKTWEPISTIDTNSGFKPYNAINEPNQLWEPNNSLIGTTLNTSFEPTTINFPNNTFEIINPITTINPTIEDNIFKWNHTPEPTITNLWDKPKTWKINPLNIWDTQPITTDWSINTNLNSDFNLNDGLIPNTGIFPNTDNDNLWNIKLNQFDHGLHTIRKDDYSFFKPRQSYKWIPKPDLFESIHDTHLKLKDIGTNLGVDLNFNPRLNGEDEANPYENERYMKGFDLLGKDLISQNSPIIESIKKNRELFDIEPFSLRGGIHFTPSHDFNFHGAYSLIDELSNVDRLLRPNEREAVNIPFFILNGDTPNSFEPISPTQIGNTILPHEFSHHDTMTYIGSPNHYVNTHYIKGPEPYEELLTNPTDRVIRDEFVEERIRDTATYAVFEVIANQNIANKMPSNDFENFKSGMEKVYGEIMSLDNEDQLYRNIKDRTNPGINSLNQIIEFKAQADILNIPELDNFANRILSRAGYGTIDSNSRFIPGTKKGMMIHELAEDMKNLKYYDLSPQEYQNKEILQVEINGLAQRMFGLYGNGNIEQGIKRLDKEIRIMNIPRKNE